MRKKSGWLHSLPQACVVIEDSGTMLTKSSGKRGVMKIHVSKSYSSIKYQFSSVQSLSHVRLFATPWTTAYQASLSIPNSWSPPKPMSVESVMPSNHLILSSPSPPALNLSQHQDLFKWVSSLHQMAKVLEFQLQHQSFPWIPRTDLHRMVNSKQRW